METSWPTSSTQLSSADQWRRLFGAALGDGVIRNVGNELAGYADASGMWVKLPTGVAIVAGTAYNNDALRQVTVANGNTLPRIDRLVLRYDFAAGTVTSSVKAGTPNATPAPPVLQRDASAQEISLLQVAVDANISTSIAASKVTDERPYANARSPSRLSSTGGTASGLIGATITTLTVPARGFPYRLVIRGNLLVTVSASADYYVSLRDGGNATAPAVTWSAATVLDNTVLYGGGGSARTFAYLDVTDGGQRAIGLYLQRSTGSGTATCTADATLNRLDVEIIPL